MMAKLGLRAKRTVRAILWTCEEFGGYGGESYAMEHKTEMGNISLAIGSTQCWYSIIFARNG